MMVTETKIRRWFNRRTNARYMVVHSDHFSYEYYPSYVSSDEELREELEEARKQDMHSIKEVYSYDDDIEEQLNQNKTWNVPRNS